MKPFFLHALPVVRVWGGRRLAELRRFDHDPQQPVGESWEIHGSLSVRGGPDAGQTLDQVCFREGERLLGAWGRAGDRFPLLIKWLDSREWLSVQVHPDDRLARELHGEQGKTEAWYFCEVASAPSGEVIHGFQDPVPADLQRLNSLRRFRPHPGEWLYIPAGTVHALGPGLLVYEVQQSSDRTYRIYDWERMGLDGGPRELHLEQAQRAVRESAEPLVRLEAPDCLGQVKIACPHFVAEQVEGSRVWSPAGNSVELLTSLGPSELRCEGERWELGWGDTAVVPANAGRVEWQCLAQSNWIRVRLAPPAAQESAT